MKYIFILERLGRPGKCKGLQVFSEWLQYRENDPPLSGKDRIPFNIVEYPIRLRVIMRIQPVQVEYHKKGDIRLRPLGDISFLSLAGLIVQYIELKPGLLNIGQIAAGCRL